jgi:OOP family OmpA-OmpF porin
VLQMIAAVLIEHPDWIVSIEGHTDAIGSETDNQALSERRAGAVRDALVSGHGIAEARLEAKGFGEAKPIETNETLDGRARNRRVELARVGCP